ncbi:phospholipase D family protein [Allosphingosinicella indica]|uniref:phospholipase D family protein n=1 Tax=Allosphingosinicella indica TaxID=941907 RepID=UPI000A152CC3
MIGPRKNRVTFQEVYATREFYRRFVSSLSESIERITICSPYFHLLPKPFDNIIKFCGFLQRRGIGEIVIITRPPGVDSAAMSLDTARRLDADGISFFIRANPYLHAKMYHIEYSKGHFRSFVGSANFTIGGLERNHEVMAELEGVGPASPCERELARMTGNGALTFPAWVHRHKPAGAGETI